MRIFSSTAVKLSTHSIPPSRTASTTGPRKKSKTKTNSLGHEGKNKLKSLLRRKVMTVLAWNFSFGTLLKATLLYHFVFQYRMLPTFLWIQAWLLSHKNPRLHVISCDSANILYMNLSGPLLGTFYIAGI